MYTVNSFICAECNHNLPLDELSQGDLTAINNMTEEEVLKYITMEDMVCVHCEDLVSFDDDDDDEYSFLYDDIMESDGSKLSAGRRSFLAQNY